MTTDHNQDARTFVSKTQESLESPIADFEDGRYNSCANRCYYACFQVAVAASFEAGLQRLGQANREVTGPYSHNSTSNW